MPKDEFDFEDPFELNGMAFLTREDTTNDMAECFTEEFMRMGYNHKQVLQLFRNPQYLGPHMAYEKRGEPFIRDLIAEVFARWGRAVTWPAVGTENAASPQGGAPLAPDAGSAQLFAAPELRAGNFQDDAENHPGETRDPRAVEDDETLTDPMGAPIPKLNL